MNWEIEHPYGESGTYIGDENTALICKIYPDGERHRHLIAAVPELLAACKQAWHYIHACKRPGEDRDNPSYTINIVENVLSAAIAKAIGRE